MSSLDGRQDVFLASAPLNQASVVQDVYDGWYKIFWQEEQTGERLDRDLQLIRKLGQLVPHSHVLDLACAYGRIANALAAEGHRVTGVDISQPLLESARTGAAAARLVEYLEVDLRNLVLHPTYDCALLWATSFGHFAEAGDLTILERARASLLPGGRLLIETRHWDSMRRDFEPTTVRRSGDDFLIEHHTYDPQTGIQWTQQILLVGGQRLHREYGVRRYTFAEMRYLCLRAGFARVSGYSELGEPLKQDSRRCVLVAT
jgi:SAM-dependent methyltransferase